MVHTWIADVSALCDEAVYEKYYKELPDFRREKADRLRFPEDRAQSVGAWTLWEKMRVHCGLDAGTVFNLSHSGPYALCSLSAEADVRVGCDVETVRALRLQVAERFFLPGETARILSRRTSEEQAEEFYRLWVLKESFMKAVRRGMGLDTRSFEIGFDGEDRPVLLRKPAAYPEEYYYQEYCVPGIPARIAVCSTDGQFGEIRVVRLE